jgi:macrolide phosphotransferase
LILAALAADAAPGKNFRAIRKLRDQQGVDSLQLQDPNNFSYLFKIPTSPEGEGKLATERAVIHALSPVAEQLPFQIPQELGQTKDADGTQGALFSEVVGNEPDLARLAPGAFSKTLADALSALHSLDPSLLRQAGLPEYDSTAQLHNKVSELDAMAGIGRIPANLLTRWEQALEDVGLFRYHPVVIHGSVSKDCIKLDGQRVVGLTGFENLKISDPAEDFAWLVGGGLGSTVEDTFLHYRSNRDSVDENIWQRATLYSELELGSWLVYCLENGDESMINQAEDLLTDLRDQLEAGTLRDLRASSFAGLVAGSDLLPDLSATMPVETVSLEEASVPLETVSLEEIGLEEVQEFEADEEPEQENKSESNPDELF